MEQLVIAAPPDGSIGALLRAYRHWALLSQEQLAARAGLSERTVRDLEAGRVRTPRTDTMRLLADALQLSGPERASWLAAARGLNHQRTKPPELGADVCVKLPGNDPVRPPGRWGSAIASGRRSRHSPVRELEAEVGGALNCADRRELVELRRENRRLRGDLETLRRAAAILANAGRDPQDVIGAQG